MDKPKPPRQALIVHAGAWAIPPEERAAHREGSGTAAAIGWETLQRGGSAVDAVCDAIRSMEADRRLNAGPGSVLTQAGHVENDAGVMCGTLLKSGGVAALRHREHPIDAARKVLDSKYVLLVGEGAESFLDARDVPRCDPGSLIEQRERDRLQAALLRDPSDGADFSGGGVSGPADTVGAVAIDGKGRIAAGASTGGVCGKPPGRMGDTAIPGAGFYADTLFAGAACTGWGEPLLCMGLARRAVDLASQNNAMDATWLALRELETRFAGYGGVILIARDGSIGYAFNTPSMAVAYMDGELLAPFVGGVRPDLPPQGEVRRSGSSRE